MGDIANCASQPPSKRGPQETLGVAGVKGAGPGALFFSLVLKKPFCYSMMTIVNTTVQYTGNLLREVNPKISHDKETKIFCNYMR